MKVLENLKIIIVSLLLLGAAAIICATMLFSKIYVSAGTGNKLADYLLANVTIKAATETDQWSQEYPFQTSFLDRYEDKVDDLEDRINDFCTTSFPEREKIQTVLTNFRYQVLRLDLNDVSDSYSALKTVKTPADNTIEFAEEMENRGIPFLYMGTPTRWSVAYMHDEMTEELMPNVYIGENHAAFMSRIVEAGLPNLDISTIGGEDALYDPTEHWFAESGLLYTPVLAERLNSDYEFNIDTTMYDLSNFHDYLEDYPEQKAAIDAVQNCEYHMYVPNEEGHYCFDVGEGATVVEGTFSDAYIQPAENWSLDGAYHSMLNMANLPIQHLHNYDATEHKSILIIGDSYNWPIATYLSMGVEDITVIYNPLFTGSILTYIEKNQPDMVIMDYNDAALMPAYIDDDFDLR